MKMMNLEIQLSKLADALILVVNMKLLQLDFMVVVEELVKICILPIKCH